MLDKVMVLINALLDKLAAKIQEHHFHLPLALSVSSCVRSL